MPNSRKENASAKTPEVIEAPASVPLNSALIETALEELRNRMVIGMSVAALGVGEYLLDAFFGGDPERYRSRKRDGNPSFDALLQRPELESLNLSRSRLYDCVGIWIQRKEIGVEGIEQLPLSHQVALLPAPASAKKRLAEAAIEKRLSVRALKGDVQRARERNKGATKVGRPPLPAFVKTIHRLDGILRDGSKSFGDLRQAESLDPKEAEALWKTITGMKLKCEELQAVLAPRVPGFVRSEE